MLRIGQFSETFYPIVDGVGRVVFNYAKTLALSGHESYVITPMANTGYRGSWPFEIIDYTGVPVPGSPQYRTGLAILDPHYHARIDNVSFDIVHAHTPFFAGREALRMSVRHRCPVVGTFHSKYYDDFYKATHSHYLAKLGVKFVVEFYEQCDEVWAVSHNSAAALQEYGYKGDIVIMDNGVEIRKPDPAAVKEVYRRFSIPIQRPFLLFVGQLNWKKNILHILEAAARLRRSGVIFTLVLAGQGPDQYAIKEKCRVLGIEDITRFTGHITDPCLLDGLYRAASLFVFPSLYDNAPMVLREAAVMQTPAVLTRGSSSAEVIRDGENGLLAGNSSEDLAAVLANALAHPEELEAIGVHASQTIPISWDEVMQRVLSRYELLIERCRLEESRPLRLRRRSEWMQDK